jgi:hypothetical protein
MTMRSEIIDNLRSGAAGGAGICSLVAVIKEAMGTEATAFAVMSLLIDAFDVSLADIRELPGARCLGGQVYSDEDIERLVYPAIQRALGARY